jgi:O-antigen/teichoic acid export membrane protein
LSGQTNIKNKVANGTKWTLTSTIFITMVQFIQTTVLARILDPSDFGLMGMVAVVVGFAMSFADMGISNAIIYRQNTTGEQLSSLYWLNMLSGFTVFAVIWGLTPLIVAFFHEPKLSNLTFWVAIIFPITSIGQQFQILFQKDLGFNYLSRIEMTSALTGALAAISSAFMGLGVFSLVIGQLSNASLKSILLFVFGIKKWPVKLYFSRKDTQGYIKFGLYQMGEKGINYLNNNIDNLLIGTFLGTKALGYYSFAYNLVVIPVSKINPMVTRIAFPVFAKMQNEIDRLKIWYFKVVEVLCFVNTPILLGLAATAPVVIPFIFGEKWIPSVLIIQILSGVGLLRSISNPVGSLILAKGRADLSFKWNAIFMVIQIPGIFIGLKLYGVLGVAISYIFLLLINLSINYFKLIRAILGKCSRDYLSKILPTLSIGGFMAILVGVIGMKISTPLTVLLIIIQVVSGAIIYFSLSFIFKKDIFVSVRKLFFKKEA